MSCQFEEVNMAAEPPFLTHHLWRGLQDQFRRSSPFCDVILCDHSESPTIRYISCHSSVLSSLSSFLRQLLRSHVGESPIYLSLPQETPFATLKTFLKEIYEKMCHFGESQSPQAPSSVIETLSLDVIQEQPPRINKRRKPVVFRKDLSPSVDNCGFIPRLGRFICPWHCGELFRSSHALSSHLKTHNVPSSFMCEECGVKKDSQGSLLAHKNTVHREMRCKHCGQTFFGRTALKRHIEITHLSRVKCTLCPKDFQSPRYLSKHLLTLHKAQEPRVSPPSENICAHCGTGFVLYSQLHGHIRRKHRRLKCPHCDRRFRHMSLYNLHLKCAHTHKRLLSCGVCSFVSLDRGSLLMHKAAKHGKRPPKPPKIMLLNS